MLMYFIVIQLFSFGGGHMSQTKDIGPNSTPAEIFHNNLINENLNAIEFQQSLLFYPSSLNFGGSFIGTTRFETVTLFNKNSNKSVHLRTILGKTADFYSSFFTDKIVPPLGNTTFNVVFLPRSTGLIQTNLIIHSSFGQAKLMVEGEGLECPYKIKPLLGIKAPFNATLTPEIYMYNPHSEPIQILEVYSSGGQFQLELPSGGQEGPQVLWEIQPYCTKPVIRIRFHGMESGNHTSFIRIKISRLNEKLNEVLVIPVEFEVFPQTGIYIANPIINFGKVTKNIEIFNINLLNSGKDKTDIIDYTLKNVKGLILFDKTNLTLTLNPNLANENTIINGELIIKTKKKEKSTQFMNLSVEIHAEVYMGSLSYDPNLTVFITGAKNYSKDLRNFIFKNNFNVPIAITNISSKNNYSSVFILKSFGSIILEPSETKKLFSISVIDKSANIKEILNIETNITLYEIPIVICTGMLKRYTSTDKANLSKFINENVLDFGNVPFGEYSQHGFIIIENPNPIPIQLKEWNYTSAPGIYYHATLLGCNSLENLYQSKNVPITERFNVCHKLLPKDVAVFQLSVQSFDTSSGTTSFKIRTEIEEIITNVEFLTVMGKLEVDQSKLHFNNCFPGKRCSADISIHSTFLKGMRVNSITVSVPGLIFEYHTQNGLPEILANSVTDIGRIHFDPKSVCLDKCYVNLNEKEYPAETFLYTDIMELRRRTEIYRRFKWNLQTITFTLNTTDVWLYKFYATVDIIWPKLVNGPHFITTIEIGQKQISYIEINNPLNQVLSVHLSLSNPDKAKTTSISLPLEVVEICSNCYLTDQDVFFLGKLKNEVLKLTLQPNSVLSIPIEFNSKKAGTYTTLLHIQNNFTMYEALWIIAKAVQPEFRFSNRKPGSSTPLYFDITENYLNSCMESGNTIVNSQLFQPIKKSFIAKNIGEVPIFVSGFKIEDYICEGYGFKILNCESFELEPNSSKKIDISFLPDFTISKVQNILTIQTNLSYSVNYTLLVKLPFEKMEKCVKFLTRPHWENSYKKISLTVVIAVLIVIFSASFLHSDQILRNHVENMYKDRGPVHLPLDLRIVTAEISVNREEIKLSPNNKTEKNPVKINSNITTKRKNIRKTNITTQPGISQEKSWAEELAKKLSHKKSNPKNTIKPSNSLKENGFIKQDGKPIVSKTNKDSIEPSQIIVNNIKPSEDLDKKLVQQIDSKKAKTPLRKAKSSPPIHANIKSGNSPKQNTECDNNFSVKKISPKEKLEYQMNNKKSTIFLNESQVIMNQESSTLNKSFSPIKIGCNQKKHGKTPGRERKKETISQNRTEKKVNKYKNTAFQFQSPLYKSDHENKSNILWDANHVSFSRIVSQNALDTENNINSLVGFDKIDNNIFDIEHDWNEADLKNNETFGTDENINSPINLGPIGTRKSPLSQQIWEPLPVDDILRPKPQLAQVNSNINSYFTNPSPCVNLQYSRDNQYLGGTAGLLSQLLSESQQQQSQYQSNDILLSSVQNHQNENINEENNNWSNNNYLWSSTNILNGISLNVDNRYANHETRTIRPPPGLTIRKRSNSTQRENTIQPQQQLDGNYTNLPDTGLLYDPFSSISSIWSEAWHKNNKK